MNEDLFDQLETNEMMEFNPLSSANDNEQFTALAQLSQLNYQNDQMYKRALENSEENHSQIRKTSKKFVDLSCVICGDVAIGFNYDVLTCASCKAFFRRNAKYNPDKVRCLSGGSNCLISYQIARKCQQCRLRKCLTMGMRKDFIISEEDKQRRIQRIEDNRKLSQQPNYFVEENDSKQKLTMKELSDIEEIRRNYSLMYENLGPVNRNYDVNDRATALISWSNIASERALRLIYFFRTIDNFERLNENDRFTLIKFNLYPLSVLQKSFFYDPISRRFAYPNPSTDSTKRREFFRLCYGSTKVPQIFRNLIHSLSIVTERDATLISLLLAILLFSKGLSMTEQENYLADSKLVFEIQSYYVHLLWNYLLSKHDYLQTIRQFNQIVQQIHQLQFYTRDLREFFQEQDQNTDLVQRLAPLMQTVLNIN